jgi:hypothetical protein
MYKRLMAMFLLTTGTVVTAAMTLTAPQAAPQVHPDDAGVRQAIQHYFAGHATGRAEVMEQAFHPSARLQSVRNGEVAVLPLERFLAGLSGQPATDEDRRVRRIESVDIAGDAAMVKVILDYPGVYFVDYMSLLKVNGEWKIVNKIFHAERRAP